MEPALGGRLDPDDHTPPSDAGGLPPATLFNDSDAAAHEMIAAARSGDLERVNALILAEVPLGSLDFGDRSALMWASAEGNFEIVARLLDAGADPNQFNSHGRTALMFAAAADRHEVIARLLAAGARWQPRDSAGRSALKLYAAGARTTGASGAVSRLKAYVRQALQATCSPFVAHGSYRPSDCRSLCGNGLHPDHRVASLDDSHRGPALIGQVPEAASD